MRDDRVLTESSPDFSDALQVCRATDSFELFNYEILLAGDQSRPSLAVRTKWKNESKKISTASSFGGMWLDFTAKRTIEVGYQ